MKAMKKAREELRVVSVGVGVYPEPKARLLTQLKRSMC